LLGQLKNDYCQINVPIQKQETMSVNGQKLLKGKFTNTKTMSVNGKKPYERNLLSKLTLLFHFQTDVRKRLLSIQPERNVACQVDGP
jgi:flagellin-like hook-associated protein FlgL